MRLINYANACNVGSLLPLLLAGKLAVCGPAHGLGDEGVWLPALGGRFGLTSAATSRDVDWPVPHAHSRALYERARRLVPGGVMGQGPGFRIGLAGAQGMLGVTPDITPMGKAFANGMPISA